MWLNTMTISAPEGAMSVREIEDFFQRRFELRLQLSIGLVHDRQPGVAPPAGQLEIQWLTNWPDRWATALAQQLSAVHPVHVRFMENRVSEGIGLDRYAAGSPNHLMPDGVNPRIPAAREFVFELGEQTSLTEWEDRWIFLGSSRLGSALRSIETHFELVGELDAALKNVDDEYENASEDARSKLISSLREAAHALIAAIPT